MEERFLNGKKRDKTPQTPWQVWDETPKFNDGKAYDTDFLTEKYTLNIREFNSYVANDERVEQIIIPIGDGMSVCRKI